MQKAMSKEPEGLVDFSAIRHPVTLVSGTLLVVSLMAAATTTGSALDLTEH